MTPIHILSTKKIKLSYNPLILMHLFILSNGFYLQIIPFSDKVELLIMITSNTIKLLVFLSSILMLIISFVQQHSIAQETPDYFQLSCTNITSQVNQLLESKGPVQRNMIDLKNMTFLMGLYNGKCG